MPVRPKLESPEPKDILFYKEGPPVPFSLIPRGVYPAVTQISPKALAEKGVRLVGR